MANLENLRKRAKALVKQHRDRYWPVAQQLRLHLPRLAGLSDREVLEAPFALADAHDVVAHEAGYESWAAATRELKRARKGDRGAEEGLGAPRLLAAYPQLFVAEVARSAAFYKEKLGFSIEYLYGSPPFYALVARDGVGLNLRHVDRPAIDPALRDRELLLAATIIVEVVKALFLELRARGVEIVQPLKTQPWGASDFILRDPDGNLLCFASPASAKDKAAREQAG